MSTSVSEIRHLKVGSYIVIGDQPCKIVEYSTSKPGKHGEAKARIVAINIITNTKKSIVHPVKHRVHVPNIDRRQAQVISIMGEEVQLMDMETYETFNLPIPEEYEGKLEPGMDVQYMVAMDKKMITRAK